LAFVIHVALGELWLERTPGLRGWRRRPPPTSGACTPGRPATGYPVPRAAQWARRLERTRLE